MANDVPWTLESFTASDGYRCHYRHYPATRTPRARVVCIHGIQSHAGWYVYSCERLARAGFDVFFLDRRGSGRNELARGDAPSFRRLLDDMAEFLAKLRTPNPELRTFLLAISWVASWRSHCKSVIPAWWMGSRCCVPASVRL